MIPKEFPGITGREHRHRPGIRRESRELAVRIVSEQYGPASVNLLSRSARGDRWIERLERVQLRAGSSSGRFRQKGVYLITGGLGDLALVIALELASHWKARLILLGRRRYRLKRNGEALEAGSTSDRIKQQMVQADRDQVAGSRGAGCYGRCLSPRRRETSRSSWDRQDSARSTE